MINMERTRSTDQRDGIHLMPPGPQRHQQQTPPQGIRHPLGAITNKGPSAMTSSYNRRRTDPSPLRNSGDRSGHDTSENDPHLSQLHVRHTDKTQINSRRHARATSTESKASIWADWQPQSEATCFGPRTSTPNVRGSATPRGTLQQYGWLSSNTQRTERTARKLFGSPQQSSGYSIRRRSLLTSSPPSLNNSDVLDVSPVSTRNSVNLEDQPMRIDRSTEIQSTNPPRSTEIKRATVSSGGASAPLSSSPNQRSWNTTEKILLQMVDSKSPRTTLL